MQRQIKITGLSSISAGLEYYDFIKFPFKLYKESKYWVPPIINQEINTFNKDLNPNLKSSEVELFIAIKENEIVELVDEKVRKTNLHLIYRYK